MIVKVSNVSLAEIEYIKLDCAGLGTPFPSDFEIKPKRAALGIGVRLHEKVVFIFIDYIGTVEVTAFIIGIELEDILFIDIARELGPDVFIQLNDIFFVKLRVDTLG